MNLLRHLLVPHSRNNHRAKILHNSTLFVMVFCVLFLSFFSIRISNTNPEVLGISYSINTQEMLVQVNSARIANNLPPLTMNDQLSNAALSKAQHMFANNYWAHFAPDGTSPWGFIKNAGYSYQYAGENLAKGFTNSNDVVNAWLASPTHRDNIMSNKYNDIGFAVLEGQLEGEETVLVVQMLGSTTSTPVAQALAQVQNFQAVEQQVIPTPTIVVVQATPVQQEPEILVAGSNYYSTPIVDFRLTTKSISFIILGFLLLALVIDLFVIRRKNIPRFVGHNLDHIIIVSLFIVFVLLSELGVIL